MTMSGFDNVGLAAALQAAAYSQQQWGSSSPTGWAAAQASQASQASSAAATPVGNELPQGQLLTGTVKAWKEEKGFGFVTPNTGGPDVFVHRNQLTDGPSLVQGALVTFECRFNPARAKYEATSCSGATPGGGSPAALPPAAQGGGKGTPAGCGMAPNFGGYEGYDGGGFSMMANHYGGFGGFKQGGQDNLFVAGLPLDVTEDRVRELFGQYGTVSQCKILPDQPGKADRAALVRFGDEAQARWMVENMNGNIPVGLSSPLVVRFAGDRPGATPPMGGWYGKSSFPALTDNRFAPYGAVGGATASPADAAAAAAAAAAAGTAVGTQLSDASLATTLVQLLPALQQHQMQHVGSAAAMGQASAPLALDLGAAGACAGVVVPAAASPVATLEASPGASAASLTAAATTAAAAAVAQAQAARVAQEAAAALCSTVSASSGSGEAQGATSAIWLEAQDPATGKPYYYHAITRETRWDRPVEMG